MLEAVDPGLVRDVARSARVLARHPLLPLVALAPVAIPQLVVVAIGRRSSSNGGALAAAYAFQFPLSAFYLGFLGTARVWYLRALRGRRMAPREVVTLTWWFLGRYFALAFVVAILFYPVFFLLLRGLTATDVVVFFIPFIVLDMLLTFVTPALAFTTRSVRRALRIGLSTIKREWGSARWYVLVPPLAISLVSRAVRPTAGVAAVVVPPVAAELLTLLFRGATAAFYLRRHETGDDGAAHAP